MCQLRNYFTENHESGQHLLKISMLIASRHVITIASHFIYLVLFFSCYLLLVRCLVVFYTSATVTLWFFKTNVVVYRSSL